MLILLRIKHLRILLIDKFIQLFFHPFPVFLLIDAKQHNFLLINNNILISIFGTLLFYINFLELKCFVLNYWSLSWWNLQIAYVIWFVWILNDFLYFLYIFFFAQSFSFCLNFQFSFFLSLLKFHSYILRYLWLALNYFLRILRYLRFKTIFFLTFNLINMLHQFRVSAKCE